MLIAPTRVCVAATAGRGNLFHVEHMFAACRLGSSRCPTQHPWLNTPRHSPEAGERCGAMFLTVDRQQTDSGQRTADDTAEVARSQPLEIGFCAVLPAHHTDCRAQKQGTCSFFEQFGGLVARASTAGTGDCGRTVARRAANHRVEAREGPRTVWEAVGRFGKEGPSRIGRALTASAAGLVAAPFFGGHGNGA